MQVLVENSNNWKFQESPRRQRLHELVVALIGQQEQLELFDTQASSFEGNMGSSKNDEDPARCLERNRRILQKYQALVRSAITLDALIDSEQFEPGRNT